MVTHAHSFSADCIRRIQWLEEIIQTQLPHVDLGAGPPLDGSTKAAFSFAQPRPIAPSPTPFVPTSENNESSFPNSHEANNTTGHPLLGGPTDQSPQPDCWESPPGDSDIADEVRALAQSLGQVSLHADSRQTYYLGTSTGILFAHLIGASSSGYRDPSGPAVVEDDNGLGDASLERLRTTLFRVSDLLSRCLVALTLGRRNYLLAIAARLYWTSIFASCIPISRLSTRYPYQTFAKPSTSSRRGRIPAR